MNLQDLIKRIIEFRDDRDWKQFHDPKNLAEAISIEAAGSRRFFCGKASRESKKIAAEKRERISEELADIFNFGMLLAHEAGIDIEKAILKKIEHNDRKYPVDRAKGSSKKYTELK